MRGSLATQSHIKYRRVMNGRVCCKRDSNYAAQSRDKAHTHSQTTLHVDIRFSSRIGSFATSRTHPSTRGVSCHASLLAMANPGAWIPLSSGVFPMTRKRESNGECKSYEKHVATTFVLIPLRPSRGRWI